MEPVLRRRANPFELATRDWGDLFNAPLAREFGSLEGAYPADIREDENNIIVEAELPGFDAEHIDVSMEQGLLTIAAERQDEKQKQGEQASYHLAERQFTRVNRTFRIPGSVDENNVDCRLDNGVLRVTLPKQEQAKRRKIEIK